MRPLFLIALVLFPLLSVAQETDTSKSVTATPPPLSYKTKIRYKSTVISMPFRVIRDEGHSPLFYKGPTFQVAAYNERWRPKAYTKFEMVLGIGFLESPKKGRSTVSTATALNMEINYHYMIPVGKIFKGKGDWYLGGIFTNTFDGRLYPFLPNNSFGYEFSNVLNPATHFTYNFNLGKHERRYQAGFKLNFALLAHVIRPNYIAMEPYETYMGENINSLAIFTNGNKIALPNRFLRINTEIYLDRFKKTSNDKYRFFYGWGFHVTKLKDSNPLYSFQHNLGAVIMLYSEKTQKLKPAQR